MKKIDKEMPFFDHLDELRVHLIRVLWVFSVCFFLAYFLCVDYVLQILKEPLFKILPLSEQKLYFTHLFERFLLQLKASGYVAVLLVSPYASYEMWSFVSPGLKDQEKKWIIPFMGLALLFMLLGVLFAYYMVLPMAFKFFLTFGSETDIPLLTIDQYYMTVIKLLLLFGLAFEFPVVLGVLFSLGLLSSKDLILHRKNAVVFITFLCALFAPPDAISMLLLMAPLILFYEMSLQIMKFFEKKENSIFMKKS